MSSRFFVAVLGHLFLRSGRAFGTKGSSYFLSQYSMVFGASGVV